MLAARMQMAAANSVEAFSDDNMPWLVNADVFMTAISHVNWNNLPSTSSFASQVYRMAKQSSGSQNAEINFDVPLAAGTWTFELIHVGSTVAGIYTVQLDGIAVGTIDGYRGSTTYNLRNQLTGIAVATSGKKRLKLLMATKNASSTSYYGEITHLQFKRTA